MPSFISNFMTYAAGCESPENFDIWSALVSLASIVGRRVWVNNGYFIYYPNLYVVFVAAPGGRKTTAMVMAQDLLTDYGKVPISCDAATKEAVVQEMANDCTRTFIGPDGSPVTYSPLTLCLTELTHFLGTNTQNAEHMIDFLTTIYDKVGVYKARTIGRGVNEVVAPYLNLIACTTNDAISKYLKSSVLTGGICRRAMFVKQTERSKPIAWPKITKEAQTARNACLAYAETLENLVGEFIPEPGFIEWYTPWYDALHAEVGKETNFIRQGYLSSKHIMAFKLAMLLTLSEKPELILRVDAFKAAVALLESRVEKEMLAVFEGTGRNELNALSNRLLIMIRSCGGKMRQKTAEMELWRDATTPELLQLIQHLVKVGQVIQVDQKHAKSGEVIARWLYLPDTYQTELGEKAASVDPAKATPPP